MLYAFVYKQTGACLFQTLYSLQNMKACYTFVYTIYNRSGGSVLRAIVI